MSEEIIITRRQMRETSATDEWYAKHMKGRGSLPLSKVVTCAPVPFSVRNFDPDFTGVVTYVNETKIWYRNGKYHRECGPAIDAPDYKHWYLDGVFCRDEADFHAALQNESVNTESKV